MKATQNPRYWIEKRAKRKTGYPIGTIAYYGPDAAFASKVVVAIITTERAVDPEHMQKWVTTGGDVRDDPAINQEILTFLDIHRVERVAMVDRLIGCPHEEGIDYPSGAVCPLCPYWAGRDRWTGESTTASH